MATIVGAYLAGQGKPLPVVPQAPPNPVTALATAGVAIVAVLGPINGGYIVNPANAAAQKIATAENAYLDMVATPGSTDAAANGTCVLLQPGQDFYLPALSDGVQVKLNAATSAHAFTVVVW